MAATTATSGMRARLRYGARGSLTRGEWRSLMMMAAVVVGTARGRLFPADRRRRSPPLPLWPAPGAFTVGLGITAYTLGLRHAFDADHIAAIDNTTRKLMAEGQRR